MAINTGGVWWRYLYRQSIFIAETRVVEPEPKTFRWWNWSSTVICRGQTTCTIDTTVLNGPNRSGALAKNFSCWNQIQNQKFDAWIRSLKYAFRLHQGCRVGDKLQLRPFQSLRLLSIT